MTEIRSIIAWGWGQDVLTSMEHEKAFQSDETDCDGDCMIACKCKIYETIEQKWVFFIVCELYLN